MSGKAYLMKFKRLNSNIKARQEQIENFKSIATNITSNFVNVKVQKSRTSDKIQYAIAKIIDVENILAAEIEELISLQKDISSKVENLENEDYRLLLTLRYLNFKTWEEIAEEMNYTYQWVHKLHGKALIEFERVNKLPQAV